MELTYEGLVNKLGKQTNKPWELQQSFHLKVMITENYIKNDLK